MNNPRNFPMSSAFKDIGRSRRTIPESSKRKSTIERLSTPKTRDQRWIPDRPSVYWLDYILDPTPHKLKDPDELASYYDNFEPRFPRTKLLSAPRSNYAALCREDDDSLNRPISVNTGIPISALTYNATERIKELARPKTSIHNNFTETSSTQLRPTTTSRQSLQTARSHSPKVKVPQFDPIVDLARGDFPSRSKHAIHQHASKERVMSTTPSTVQNNNLNLRSRSSSSYHKTGGTVTRDILRNDKKGPISRTLYSGRH